MLPPILNGGVIKVELSRKRSEVRWELKRGRTGEPQFGGIRRAALAGVGDLSIDMVSKVE